MPHPHLPRKDPISLTVLGRLTPEQAAHIIQEKLERARHTRKDTTRETALAQVAALKQAYSLRESELALLLQGALLEA